MSLLLKYNDKDSTAKEKRLIKFVARLHLTLFIVVSLHAHKGNIDFLTPEKADLLCCPFRANLWMLTCPRLGVLTTIHVFFASFCNWE